MLYEIEAKFLVEMNDHLGVGVIVAESMPGSQQWRAQFHMIVNLSVENNGDRFVFVENRLLAGFDVDDRQSPHPKRNPLSLPVAGGVRAAVMKALGHTFEQSSAGRTCKAGDTAHFEGQNLGVKSDACSVADVLLRV